MREDFLLVLFESCVIWPLVEEAIHRLAICLLLFVAFGKMGCHRSQRCTSLLLPLVLHGLGNLIVAATLEALARHFGFV